MIDVLVIGAGPTGLMMAIEAIRHHLSCRIIDKALKPADQSRALAIQPRTLEIFDHIGLSSHFLNAGLKIGAGNQCFGSKKLFRLEFEKLDSPYPFMLSLEQSRTEEILVNHLNSLGAKAERGLELIDLVEKEDHTLAICQDAEGKKSQIEAKWVVGCDGAHSLVRKTLSFSFIGKAFSSTFSLADVKIEWDYPHDELYAFLNPKGLLGAIPMPGEGRYRLVFERIGEETELTFEEVKKILKERVARKALLSDPTWLANFHINSRLVQSYQKGRIFLAGDAAHIHSPAGGQGMNSGLQDAFNLAWKLSSNNLALINTYTLERRSWGKNLLKATKLFTELATLKNPIAIAMRNALLKWVAPLMQKKIIEAISEISIQYPKSLIALEAGSFQGGPKAGTRAPNLFLGNTDLYSAMRNTTKHHLLAFRRGAKEFSEFASNKMAIISVDHPEAARKYGVKSQGIYIIRPDQYIGYRNSAIDLNSIRQYTQNL